MTKSMEQQLVDYGHHLQDLVDDMAVPIGTESPTRLQPDAPRRRLRWRLALAAFAVPLLLIGGLVYLLGPFGEEQPPVTAPLPPQPTVVSQPEPTSAPQPEPTSEPAAEPTTQPLAPHDISTGWSKVPYDPEVFGDGVEGTLNAVTPGGPGLVAVGTLCGSEVCEAGVWVSADGVAWQRAPGVKDLFETGGLPLGPVAASPSGVVAGTECSGDGNLAALCDPGMWFSPDGLVWERVEMSTEVFTGCSSSGAPRDPCTTYWNTIVAGGPGFVAAGKDLRGPGIWASADGRDWSRVAEPDMFPDTGWLFEIWELATVGPTVVAFAELDADVFNEDGDVIGWTESAYLWTSLDGINWEPVPDPDEVLASGTIYDAVEWDGGLAATGRVCVEEEETCEVVWLSPDGLTWSFTRLPEATGIVAGETGLIAYGGDYFWTSSDGITWQQHTVDLEMMIWDLTWHDSVLVVVGSNPIDGTPAIYRWNP